MEDFSKTISALPDDLVPPADEALFAFIRTLRVAVQAKVAAEQQQGRPLSEIVPQVREMVRAAEEDAASPNPFPSHVYRAISRQAVAWCVEAYRPHFFAGGDSPSADRIQPLPPT